MGELSERVALVTGASRGIGRACAEALAAKGATVALLARPSEELTAAAEAIGGDALECDLRDPHAMDRALRQLHHTHGAPTILVHAAASHYRIQKLHTVSDEAAHEQLALDVSAAERLCRRVVAEMMVARFGRIVLLGSVAAHTGVAGGTLYSMAKAGYEGLVRGLTVDYARRGVTANVVTTGIADTERIRERTSGDADARAKLERFTATRKLTTPEEVAAVVAFLCTPAASAVTGTVVEATSGAHLHNGW